jgi:hypothetical protein
VTPTHIDVPTARSSGLLTERVGDETVVYDLDSKDIHCLSSLATAVFEHCDGRSTHAQIATLVQERLGKPVTVDEVSGAVAQLEECELLDTLFVVQHGLSRREAFGKVAFAGATAAFAAPLITSIAAPSAARAQSGGATGCACTTNSDCISNHCCKAAGSNDKCNNGCCAADNNGTLCQCVPAAPTTCATPPNPGPGGCGTLGPCTPSGNSPCGA